MNEESLEQYNRGCVFLYIENASLERLLELKHEINRRIVQEEALNRKIKEQLG